MDVWVVKQSVGGVHSVYAICADEEAAADAEVEYRKHGEDGYCWIDGPYPVRGSKHG